DFKVVGGMKPETVVGAEIKTNVVNKTEFIKGSAVKLHSGKEYKHEKSGKAEKSAGLIQMAKDVKQFRDAEKKIVKANKILKVAGKKHEKADKIIWDAIDTMHTTTNLKEYIKADRNEKQATKTVKTTGKQLEKAADMKFQATTIIAKGTVKLGRAQAWESPTSTRSCSRSAGSSTGSIRRHSSPPSSSRRHSVSGRTSYRCRGRRVRTRCRATSTARTIRPGACAIRRTSCPSNHALTSSSSGPLTRPGGPCPGSSWAFAWARRRRGSSCSESARGTAASGAARCLPNRTF